MTTELQFNSFYLASQFKTKFSLNFNENKTNITLNLQKDEFNKKINKIVANWYKYFPGTRMIRKGDELTILSTKKNSKFSIQFDYQKFVEPKAGESEDDFMGRCIPYVMDEGKEQDQAVAICINKYEKRNYEKFYVFRLFADSSNVDAIQYDTDKLELDIRFNDGETYRYFDVDYDTFERVWKGKAACITSGENAYGAWFVGKTPSVGAALHKFLVKSNIRYERI